MTKDYQYQPLRSKEIRLLRLHPRSDNQALTGSIFHTRLKNPTRVPAEEPGNQGHLEHDIHYEAISYHWGRDLAKPYKLVIDDGSVLGLSGELHAILHSVAESGEEKAVWVDAICIDQADKNSIEKEEQIRLMPDIYRIAKRVRVHLGQATEDSDVAIQFINKFRDAQMFCLTELPEEKLKKQTLKLMTYGSEEESSALCAFWERPW
jgi:heterokaryon incompatibility protein (HET)